MNNYVRMSAYMLIAHKGHNNTMHVYSVTVMTHVIALEAGQSSLGHLSLLQSLVSPWPDSPSMLQHKS